MINSGATSTTAPPRRIPFGGLLAGLVLITLICCWPLPDLLGLPPLISGFAVLALYALVASEQFRKQYSVGQRIAMQIAPSTVLLLTIETRFWLGWGDTDSTIIGSGIVLWGLILLFVWIGNKLRP
jgi:hypothetical protein